MQSIVVTRLRCSQHPSLLLDIVNAVAALDGNRMNPVIHMQVLLDDRWHDGPLALKRCFEVKHPNSDDDALGNEVFTKGGIWNYRSPARCVRVLANHFVHYTEGGKGSKAAYLVRRGLVADEDVSTLLK